MMSEQDALLVLNAVCRGNPSRISRLLGYFGSAVRLLQTGPNRCRATGLAKESDVKTIFSFDQDAFLRKEKTRCQEEGITVLTRVDDGFPQLLQQIFTVPLVLYVRGQIPTSDTLNVAMVGSRRASEYGRVMAKRFAERLAEKGITIVSGLARGIDTVAHLGCLEAQGRTWAVLGSGLDCLYPPENKKLTEQIVRQGAVISEFPMGTRPLPYHFPQRNRLISGLAQGTLVIEAAQRSGALSTCRYALEQGREVFALPGNVNQANAQGTNRLIQQGAKPVLSPDDVLEEFLPLGLEIEARPTRQQVEKEKKVDFALSQADQEVYNRIPQASIGIDALAETCQLDIPELLNVLFQLELKRLVHRLPGYRVAKSELVHF